MKIAMGDFGKWLVHRAGALGLSWPRGVAEVSGISLATMESIAVSNSLGGINRSARAYIARSLKVSVRELESLAAGRITWIRDEHIVDLDRLSPANLRPTQSKVVVATSCDAGKGVPILGRILENGSVEHFDYWTSEDGPRLPVRYAGMPDLFSLELKGDASPFVKGQRLVFEPVLPGAIGDAELVLISWSEHELCRVYRPDATTLRLQSAMSAAREVREVPLEDVLRAARVIDTR